jgi:mannose-6-phosphate isomerase-like protein (cupin superfamily)
MPVRHRRRRTPGPGAGPAGAAAYALARDEGRALWTLGGLLTVKAAGVHTGGGLAVLERILPPGFESPLHHHEREDEALYVLDGHLDAVCGARAWRLGPGGFALLPRGVPHCLAVSGVTPARVLVMHSPAGFEELAAEVGRPAETLDLPPADASPPRTLDVTAAKYGIRFAGPVPGARATSA